jgi:hypothetical protein
MIKQVTSNSFKGYTKTKARAPESSTYGGSPLEVNPSDISLQLMRYP